jgi:hypothetical protein
MAAELCAHLCKAFDLPVESIVSHYEAGKTGYGSNHVDPSHWWSMYALSMDGFRDYVRQLIGGVKAPVDEVAEAKRIIAEKAGIAERAIAHLQAYEWGDDLIKKLAKAMKEFDEEGIEKLNGRDVEELALRLRAVRQAGKAYQSFTGLRSGQSGSVRFVIETEEIREKK